MAPELPSRIDRYRILDRLGNGSMGDVYLAIDPKLDRRIALKVMSSHRLGEEDELGELRIRFVQEARAAARLTHPGIVTVYDADTDGASGWPFIAMEWVNGPSLRTRLRKGGPLEIDDAVSLIAQVARALDYAHAEGVVHRDVKPANLLLDAAGAQVKIADFGVAKLVSNSLTLTGQVLGSPNYMAPEQVKAQEIDGRTDLFGLGVVLYECLAGRSPFASDSLAAITFKIVSVDPRPVEIYNPRVPASLGAIVRQALEKRPADRFQSGAAMAEALEAVQQELDSAPELSHTREIGPEIISRVESLPERDSPTTLGRRSMWWAFAAALFASAVLLGIAFWVLPATAPDLPLLTRPLGVFAETKPALPKAGTESDEGSAATSRALSSEPDLASHPGQPDASHPESNPTDSNQIDAAEIAARTPAAEGAEPDIEEKAAQETATESAHSSGQPPELIPPPLARTRLIVAVENKIRLAIISVWVDGDRVLTRRLQATSWIQRRVGQAFEFEVPVVIGRHKVEVHISGLSSKLEARNSIRGELVKGRPARLDIEIDRRRKTLNLSWRN